MTLRLSDIVDDFAAALKAVDEAHPRGSSRNRTYRPGVGPLTEADAVKRALQYLKTSRHSYQLASPSSYPGSRQRCDLVIPEAWAVELKLLRPFGDNGEEAEHWSENVLHPYPGNTSSIGDCLKLSGSGFLERKAVVVFGYEHIPSQVDLDLAIDSFEVVAKQAVGIELGNRHYAEFGPLIHPVHQHGKVFGWEVLASPEEGITSQT